MKNILKNLFRLLVISAVFSFLPVLANNSNSNGCDNSGNCCPDGMNRAQQEAQNTQQMPSLGDAMSQMGTTEFGQILEESGANQMLSKGGPYTIFAPSNEALNNLSQEDIARLRDDPAVLRRTISNHMLKGTITKENESSPDLKTLSGRKVDVTRNDQGVYINGQKIVKGIQYQNGVVYVINGVIL